MTSDDINNQPNSGNQDGNPKKRGRLYYRKARRKAKVMGLLAESDEHAAQMLEERGINVLEDEVSILTDQNMLDGGAGAGSSGGEMSEAERVTEVYKIQRLLVRRRRFRLMLLFLRLGFFVLLPTFVVGRYYYGQATDMYETKSEFVIQMSEGGGGASLGGLFSGTGFATSADSITVQGYLTSREAMIRLDDELGYRAHFQQDFIDNVQRLPKDASLEETYKLYQKNVIVGYDTTEGVIRMQVVAATPEASQAFSEALISYAEERVDQLSQRVREDQMDGARVSYEEAEIALLSAQNTVLELQQKRGVFSADAEISTQMGIISSLVLQIEEKRLSLAEILDNPNPNAVRLEVLENEIRRREDRVEELRLELTETTADNVPLAIISGELSIAESDLATRQAMLQQALVQLELARIEANRQVRYLSMGVSPVAPDVPTYPRKLESTMLAFLIFMSIYVLLSLTISVLREQVSV